MARGTLTTRHTSLRSRAFLSYKPRNRLRRISEATVGAGGVTKPARARPVPHRAPRQAIWRVLSPPNVTAAVVQRVMETPRLKARAPAPQGLPEEGTAAMALPLRVPSVAARNATASTAAAAARGAVQRAPELTDRMEMAHLAAETTKTGAKMDDARKTRPGPVPARCGEARRVAARPTAAPVAPAQEAPDGRAKGSTDRQRAVVVMGLHPKCAIGWARPRRATGARDGASPARWPEPPSVAP